MNSWRLTMRSEPQPLDILGEQIADAWFELLAARADWARSPNADSIQVEQYAQLRLNRLLERLFDSMSEQQRVAVNARPVRQMVDAG